MPVTYYSLRVIPNPSDRTKPSLAELVQSTWILDQGTFWSARGAVQLTGASALHPYHKLPILSPLPPLDPDAPPAARTTPGLSFFRGRMHVEQVTVVETY
jgi:hypothetical protein